jgi:hypothetical protein
MSFQNLPNKNIAFDHLFGGRLKKYGISTAVEEDFSFLIDEEGTKTTVQKDADGYCVFSGEMPASVHGALAQEFGLDLLFEVQCTHVVIENSEPDVEIDADFMVDWLQAAKKYDQLVKAELEKRTELFKRVSRASDQLIDNIDLKSAAALFIREVHAQRGVFCFNIPRSMWSQWFAIMVGVEFFVQEGHHYVMTIPPEPSIDRIMGVLLMLLEARDANGFLHPERYLTTLRPERAKALCCDLRNRRSARDGFWNELHISA